MLIASSASFQKLTNHNAADVYGKITALKKIACNMYT